MCGRMAEAGRGRGAVDRRVVRAHRLKLHRRLRIQRAPPRRIPLALAAGAHSLQPRLCHLHVVAALVQRGDGVALRAARLVPQLLDVEYAPVELVREPAAVGPHGRRGEEERRKKGEKNPERHQRDQKTEGCCPAGAERKLPSAEAPRSRLRLRLQQPLGRRGGMAPPRRY